MRGVKNPIRYAKEVVPIMCQKQDEGKVEGQFAEMDVVVGELRGLVLKAFDGKELLHLVEGGLFRKLMQIGLATLKKLIELHGPGDVGPIYTPGGEPEQSRQPQGRRREYQSIFGTLEIERTVYTRGCKQQEFAPLDAILGLPEGKFSYHLQDVAQMLGVDLAWERDRQVLRRLLGCNIPVDSLERMNRHMAEATADYQAQRPLPAAGEEGELFVISGDGKGIPMRREKATEEAAAPDHAPDHEPEREPVSSHILPSAQRGPLPGRKQMSVVGAIYSVDRLERTPEEILQALFRETPAEGVLEKARPKPVGKHVWAALDQELPVTEICHHDGAPLTFPAVDATFNQLAEEHLRRDPLRTRPLVRVMDGEARLWATADIYLPPGRHPDDADVLDILHVSQHLWKAAGVLAQGRQPQEAFLRGRLEQVLNGGVHNVIKGLRALATRRELRGPALQTVSAVCGYFARHAGRMRYDEYLKKGYPIASGVIEGACRHLVKDRLERTGMRWIRDGAQAMLNTRSLWLNDEWDAFQTHYTQREINRLYPGRRSLIQQNFAVTA